MKNYCAELDTVGAPWLHIHQLLPYKSVRMAVALNLAHHLTYGLHVTFRGVFHFTCESDVHGWRCLYNRIFRILSAGILAFGWRKEDRWGRRRGEPRDDGDGRCKRDGKENRDGLADRDEVAAFDSLSDREENGSYENDSGNFIRGEKGGFLVRVIPVQSSISRRLYGRWSREPPKWRESITRLFFVPRHMAQRSVWLYRDFIYFR